MENIYFIKFIEHSLEFYELIRQRPSAFVLLAIIADRARKVQLDIGDGTEVGEAYIGDFRVYGATLQSYRTDKRYLEKFKIVTFRSTSKGTVAKIVKPSIFDISRNSATNKLTDYQITNNNLSATKQEVRSEKKEESQAQPMEKKDFFHIKTSTSHLISPNNIHNLTDKKLGKEEYWDKYAPKEANELNIEMYSDQYNNGREDFVKKGKYKSVNSIREFLKNANDWDQEQRY
ncbi:MAG: hypothetical protein QG570_603 [Patescibacteria group bacterium]|jgi:hypothetical protein|nr:hypothetical protein [Patescibacteria group bacterium]